MLSKPKPYQEKLKWNINYLPNIPLIFRELILVFNRSKAL